MGRLLAPLGAVIRAHSDGESPDPVRQRLASQLYLRADFGGRRLGVELARLQAWSPVSLVRGLKGPRSGSEEHRLRWGASGKVPGLALRDSEPVDADGFSRGASGLPADG